MSNHPLGLPEDPFAVPATLSVEEAAHLIRRRVSDSGGDGTVLFPSETCAEIHALARGRPDAICDLAGSALRIAAAEGAPAVSPTHARTAAAASSHDAAGDDAAPASAAGSMPDVTGGGDPADATPVTIVDPEIDDVPDLPPFVESGFTLPRAPSESLDPDARAWVSRFIPSEGPDLPRRAAAWIAHPPTIHDVAAVSPPSSVGSRGPGARAPAASAPRPGSRRRARRRRGSATGGIAVAAVCCVAAVVLVVRQRPSGTPRPVEPKASSATSTAAELLPATTPPAAAPGSPTAPRAARPIDTPPGTSAPAPSPAAQADPSPPAASAPRLGLVVGSYIFEDRAQDERERLAAAGHPVRVMTAWESGSTVYRVVLGSFSSTAAAERAADGLLSSGTVQQARIVPLPPQE